MFAHKVQLHFCLYKLGARGVFRMSAVRPYLLMLRCENRARVVKPPSSQNIHTVHLLEVLL